ncbi:unnamed protein product [Cuscuta epithymum]|uniref:DYW domain-containing protein n=1 Tax=Cuscuta epithymum TaxID=186058 RepID=A0AAV0CDP8_9ASTE|nr:unnamed protein product [Cuscuta epithymum]
MSFLSANALGSLVESAILTRSLALGQAVHAQIIKTLESHFPPFISNHLINFYSKFGRLSSAHLVLLLTPTCSRSVVTWTALIAGSVQNGHFSSALLHFCDMRRNRIQPNDFTFPCLFKASVLLNSGFVGQQLHALAIKSSMISDVFVGCSALDMYNKTGNRELADKVFDEMSIKNIATWNACISNAVLAGSPTAAVEKFIELLRVGEEPPNSITFCVFLNACSDGLYLKLGMQLHASVIRCGYDSDISVLNGLIDFYGKCHDVKSSELVFNGMHERNGVSWCSLLATYEQNDLGEKALQFFLQAREVRIVPTEFKVSSVLSACSGLAAIDLGKSIHGLVVKSCIEGNVFVGSALGDMYGKCGCLEDGERAFDEMPKRNLITWNALIGAYAHHGRADVALDLFQEMSGKSGEVVPNYITLVCILTACSRAGAVQIGMDLFESMKGKYGIEPRAEHYACVVDMLGRAGMVDRAYKIIKEMPMQPTVSVWGALLGACRVHGKPELGKIAADSLFRIDPHDSGNHVILSNMFASSGRWEEANTVRMEMNGIGIKKCAGYSWITVKNCVHVFRAKDTTHVKYPEIFAMLTKLRKEMKGAGYIPETNLALYDLEEEEKESEVWYHSEKLALAFGLITIPHGVPIRITKNIRVCVDCHSAIKFISRIACREILVRDNNRFHHFKNGICSCGDYW